ncbi:hypothetical protein RB195_002782 [Necator americanus]|uniref:Uncharacterized protein n=1 Tax=Necator americanus TaxID=51031 RepID=A0ABR1DNG6_NECAM
MEIREVLEARPQNLIAVSARLYRECVQRGKRTLSLQQRFQDKENGRTGPVYTSISITELIASISTVVVYACIGAAISEEDGAKYLILSDVLDLIDSYRYLFINTTILLNSFLWSREQKKVLIDHATGDQYFKQLHSSWT